LACGVYSTASSPHLPLRAASVLRQEASVKYSYGFTVGATSAILLYKFENKCMSVVYRHIVGGILQSPHEHTWVSDTPHNLCTEAAWFPWSGCRDFRTIPAQPLYCFSAACSWGPVREITRCSYTMWTILCISVYQL